MRLNNIKVPFLAGAIKNNVLYFSPFYTNGLFAYDLKTNMYNYLGMFEGEKNTICLYRKAFLCGEKIWFMPNEAQRIAMYDIEKKQIFYYEIGYKANFAWDDGFYEYYRQHDVVYFIPYKSGNSLYRVDMEKNEVVLSLDTNGVLNKKLIGFSVIENRKYLCTMDGGIYIREGECWIDLDITSIKNDNISYYSILTKDNYICLIPYEENQIIVVDVNGKKVHKRIGCNSDMYYAHGLMSGKYCVVFPFEYNRNILLVNKNGMIREVEMQIEEDEVVECAEIESDNKDVYYISTTNGDIHEFDSDWKFLKKYNIIWARDFYSRFIKVECFSNENTLYERKQVGLDIFIKVLCKGDA